MRRAPGVAVSGAARCALSRTPTRIATPESDRAMPHAAPATSPKNNPTNAEKGNATMIAVGETVVVEPYCLLTNTDIPIPWPCRGRRR